MSDIQERIAAIRAKNTKAATIGQPTVKQAEVINPLITELNKVVAGGTATVFEEGLPDGTYVGIITEVEFVKTKTHDDAGKELLDSKGNAKIERDMFVILIEVESGEIERVNYVFTGEEAWAKNSAKQMMTTLANLGIDISSGDSIYNNYQKLVDTAVELKIKTSGSKTKPETKFRNVTIKLAK